MNLQARLYDPVIGRFLAVDPLAEIQIGITPYHYCGNDPINASDPSGLLLSSKVLEEIEYEERTSHERLMRVISSLNRWDLEAIAMRQQVRNGMMHDLENYRDLADGGANSAYTDLFNSTNYVAAGAGGSFIEPQGSDRNVSVSNYQGIAHIKGNGQDCLVTNMAALCQHAGYSDVTYDCLANELDNIDVMYNHPVGTWRINGSTIQNIMEATRIVNGSVLFAGDLTFSSEIMQSLLERDIPMLAEISAPNSIRHAVTIVGYNSSNGFQYYDPNFGFKYTSDINMFLPIQRNGNPTAYHYIYIPR